MKIFISIDIEGVAGVVSREHLGPQGFEYERAREFMTDELLAAVEGARAGGATEFIVADSHGNGQNIQLDRLPDDVELVRSWPRPLQMSQGVEEPGVQGAMFIGYHAGTTNSGGNMSHTMSSRSLMSIRLNGEEVSETGLNAALCGHFGVPVIMVSGDNVYVEETLKLLPNVQAAVVKWTYGTLSARSMTPSRAQKTIRENAEAAVKRLVDFKPHTLSTPVTVDLVLKSRLSIELLDYLAFMERTGANSIRFTVPDIVEASKTVAFILGYQSDL